MNSNSLSHTKWNCKYHIVFAPKLREVYSNWGVIANKDDSNAAAERKQIMKHEKLYISGMTCINCQTRIASALNSRSGIT